MVLGLQSNSCILSRLCRRNRPLYHHAILLYSIWVRVLGLLFHRPNWHKSILIACNSEIAGVKTVWADQKTEFNCVLIGSHNCSSCNQMLQKCLNCCIHTYTHACTHARTHTRTHTYTHAHTHTRTHAHTHTHTHTHSEVWPRSWSLGKRRKRRRR